MLVGEMTTAERQADDDPVAVFVAAYIATLQRDVTNARAFQVEMETLGFAARRARRETLSQIATVLTAQLNAQGRPASHAEALSTAYSIRQSVSDALDEDPHPILESRVPLLTEWATHIITSASRS